MNDRIARAPRRGVGEPYRARCVGWLAGRARKGAPTVTAPTCAITKAFTLIELLVVVTIITVLAALLMPALGSARDRAQASACASNLRQAGAVFATFLNDHNGFYPYIANECLPFNDPAVPPCSCTPAYLAGVSATPAQSPYCLPVGADPNTYHSGINWNPSCPIPPCWSAGFPNSACCANNWVAEFSPYFGFSPWNPNGMTSKNYAKALRCQSNPWPYPATLQGGGVSYRINGNMFPLTYRGAWGSANSAIPGNPLAWSKMVNLSDIDHPSSVMLLGEVAYWAAPTYWSATLPSPEGKTPAIAACYVTNLVTVNPCYCDNWFVSANYVGGVCVPVPGSGQYAQLQVTPSKSCNAMVAYWHNNGMNTLKVDGHVERVDKQTMIVNSIQLLQGQNSTPGGLFWGDGKGSGWYYNQYPGGVYPYNQ